MQPTMNKTMTNTFLAAIAAAALLVSPFAAVSSGTADKNKSAAKPTPYPLKTCLVTDEALGSMGAPYVFTHEGNEVKLCCKSCLKKFNKETATYVKKLEAAEKSGKKGAAKAPAAHSHPHPH